MIRVDIPGLRLLAVHHVVFDLNGTLATDGTVPPPVLDRIRALAQSVEVRVVTADTFGTAAALEGLGAKIVRLAAGDQSAAKAEIVRQLGSEVTAAVGNGMNDVGMLCEAALGIAVIGREGAAVPALLAADLVVTSIEDALDLLASPRRLVASLRTA